jgi:hypothetical protein
MHVISLLINGFRSKGEGYVFRQIMYVFNTLIPLKCYRYYRLYWHIFGMHMCMDIFEIQLISVVIYTRFSLKIIKLNITIVMF